MRNPEMGPGPEQEKLSPEKALDCMARKGEDLTRNAETAKAMLVEAKEKGIPVDLSSNEILKKFQPGGEYEKQLANLSAELLNIGTELFDQGVKMTKEDLEKRLSQMKESEEE